MSFFHTKIENLRGVGTQRAQLLQKELNIFTYGDLIQRYPFRYLDRTQFYNIVDLHDDLPYVQVKGVLRNREVLGEGSKQRLVAKVVDESGELELVWFKGVKYLQNVVKNHQEYIVFGKPTMFNGKPQMAHPELEEVTEAKPGQSFLQPVYNTTEKLRNYHRIDSKALARIVADLLKIAPPAHFRVAVAGPDSALRAHGQSRRHAANPFPAKPGVIAGCPFSAQV